MVQYNLLDIYSIKDNLTDYNLDNNITNKISELFNLLNINIQRNKNIRKEKLTQDESARGSKKKIQ